MDYKRKLTQVNRIPGIPRKKKLPKPFDIAPVAIPNIAAHDVPSGDISIGATKHVGEEGTLIAMELSSTGRIKKAPNRMSL